MRRLFWSVSPAVALCLTLAACAALFPSVPAHAETNVVRVGLYENPPKVFTDPETGEPAGIFPDMLEAIAEDEGWTLEWVPGTWNENLEALTNGTIDLMPDVAFSTDRDLLYDFHTTPVVESWSCVYRSPGARIEGFADLDGMRVAILHGSIQESVFLRLVEGLGYRIEIVRADSIAEAFELTAAGQADAVVASYLYGDYHHQDYGLEKTPVVFNAVPLFFAVAEGENAHLLQAIDRHLDRWIREPGSPYYHVLGAYTIRGHEPRVPGWVPWAIGVTGALLGITLVIVFIERRQIRQRNLRIATAEAAAEARDRFLASVSHELRTPLNSIIGFSAMLKEGMAGPLNEEQTFQLGMIHQSGQHLLRLINNILDLSRVQAGSVEAHPEDIDAAETIAVVAETVRPLAEQRGVALAVDVPAEGLPCCADVDLLRQVLLNLVGNAVKYTDQGSVTLHGAYSEEEARFDVIDTGRGIPESDLERIFEPFETGGRPKADRPRGTGLGLAISRDYAQLMGGDVTVVSELGRGSTFTLRLPRACSAQSS